MSYIIWDFNGTLYNDVDVGIKSINTLLSRRNLKTLDGIEEYHSVFGFPIIDYYSRVGLDFNKEPYEVLAKEWIKEYFINSENAKLQLYAIEALEKFKALGKTQVILSLSDLNILKEQLHKLGIFDYFHEIIGLENIYAETKIGIAEKWANGKDLSNSLMIGDTIHDLEVSKKMGVSCMLLSNGHQSRNDLEKCKVPVFENLKDLIECEYFN